MSGGGCNGAVLEETEVGGDCIMADGDPGIVVDDEEAKDVNNKNVNGKGDDRDGTPKVDGRGKKRRRPRRGQSASSTTEGRQHGLNRGARKPGDPEDPPGSVSSEKCRCCLSVKDELERIRQELRLSRKLATGQEADVGAFAGMVAGPSLSPLHHLPPPGPGLGERLRVVEEKLDQALLQATSRDSKDGGASNGSQQLSTFSIDSLHNKVDKLVRLLSDVTETQRKTAKLLAGLDKRLSSSAAVVEWQGQRQQQQQEQCQVNGSKSCQQLEKPGVQQQQQEPPDAQNPHPSPSPEEWGQGLTLVGDSLWRCLLGVEDVRAQVEALQGAPAGAGLRVVVPGPAAAARDGGGGGEALSRMYDSSRDRLLLALPPGVRKVAISVGSAELLKDPRLVTLREAPLSEVRRKNLPVLVAMAASVCALVRKLLQQPAASSGRVETVVLVVPLAGTQRREVFNQWEKVLKDAAVDSLPPFPSFRLLNLSDLMKTTMGEFGSPAQMVETWLSDARDPTSLSAYGTRRLFDALKKVFWAQSKQSIEDLSYLKASGPPAAALQPPPQEKPVWCARCAKSHPGGANGCNSTEKLCRKCNKLGHFEGVHEVKEANLRRAIVEVLGEGEVDFELKCTTTATAHHMFPTKATTLQGPPTMKEMLEQNAAHVVHPWRSENLDDWYN